MRLTIALVAVLCGWAGAQEPVAAASATAAHVESILPGGAGAWDLVWSEEFDGSEAALDAGWVAQNGPSSHILCSRWRENVSLGEGTLRLENRHEERGGQSWTSGSIHSRRQFTYGYFECRYRYAAAEGTNNSFWLMPVEVPQPDGVRWEIDINEGHYPNEVNTNIHNHSEATVTGGRKSHLQAPKSFPFGSRPDVRITLETPVTTRRIRIESRHGQQIQLDQVRILGTSATGYPSPFEPVVGIDDFAREAGATVTVSGCLSTEDTSLSAIDGKAGTRWASQRDGEKWLEVGLAGERTIGCVSFVNGWQGSAGDWKNLLSEYRVSYHDGTGWVPLSTFDVQSGAFNFARDFQVLGLDWNEQELVFYLNGQELRRVPNRFCHTPSPIWLSLAIIPWAGRIGDGVHGTRMEVDHVRVYRRH